MKPATKIELIATSNTAPAEQSLAILANLLNLVSTVKSTKDSIDVFINSKIKTEITVEKIIICS